MSTDNYSDRHIHHALIKSTSILALGTLISRILGFVRDVILAKILGTGLFADSLFVAFKIPNLLRDFVGEGAANSAVIPVLAEHCNNKEKKDFWHFVSLLSIYSLIILLGLTLLGVLLAHFIVPIMAPGFLADSYKLNLTIQLTKILFPYLIFIGLTAFATAILYTFRSFVVPAFSPCLLNIAIILSAVLSSSYLEKPVYGLAIGILVGGILQLLVLLFALLKAGIKFIRPTGWHHPGVTKIGKLLLPRMIGAGVYQCNVFIDTFCASLSSIVGLGGVSAIYYSNRIIQFPLGVFTIALASAVLPTLSELAVNNNIEQMKKTLVFSLKKVFFIIWPTTIILMILAQPIIHSLFERGEFNQYSTMITSSALFFYAIGLFSFGAIKIMATAFYALQDTKTPVKIAGICFGINTVLNLILMFPLQIGGIALASSLAATINLMLLYINLQKKVGTLTTDLKKWALKILLASFVMGLLVRLGWTWIIFPIELIKVIMLGLAGYLIFGFLCLKLKVDAAEEIWLWLKNRIRF